MRKNFSAVTVVVDPDDYSLVLHEIDAHQNSTTLSTRRLLAHKTFEHLLPLRCGNCNLLSARDSSSLYASIAGNFQKKMDLRYGENPHEAAALYSTTHHYPTA
ncbi:hypothetical protein [Candidatus Coxiella mudrowiae]|uniref:hypothetical protein n=1 Tax=Candidatus Coxiella mudrowiae TaxID=2054173 RepID=UPI0027D2FBE0|nr:hypothetical protein [Candidatus Coxiella mudrowiae]